MASGSSVPEWPTFRSPRTPRALADDVVATSSPPACRPRRGRRASPSPSASSGVVGSSRRRRTAVSRRIVVDRARPCAIAGRRAGTSSSASASGAALAADRGLQPRPVLAERLEHLVVASPRRGAVEEDHGAAQVGVDVDRGDGHQLEALVVDALELVGRGSRAAARSPAPCGGTGRAALLRGGRRRPRSLEPPPLGRHHLDLGERPHEALDLVDDLASAWRWLTGDHREPEPGPLPLVLVVDLGGRPPGTPAGAVEDRPDHDARFSFSERRLGRCRSTARASTCTDSSPCAQVRGSRAPRRSR